MPKRKRKSTNELLEELIEMVQNLFILHALEAGANRDDLRSLLRVDVNRVSSVSKLRGAKRKAL